MCTGCHLAPGVGDNEMRQGLYPQPPNLSQPRDRSPAQLFWIIKHGLKMTGMPAWGVTHDDEAIWGLVAFLQQLPTMDAAAYAALTRDDGEAAMVLARSQRRALPWAKRPKAAACTCIQTGRAMIIEPRTLAASAEDRAVSRGVRSPVTTAPRRVLVVEDEGDLARVVKRHVEDIGCQVRIAPSGESALEAAATQEFDLVLLDVMLPGIDGLEVCRRLRARRQYMPVLMLTARSSEIDKVLGLETGADDYLTKPFSVQELLRARHRRGGRPADRPCDARGVSEWPADPADPQGV